METFQDETRPRSDSGTPHFNVSCQTCRTTRTFVTLQGVNSFFDEHEGHKVIEGKLFERPPAAKRPEGAVEAASNQQTKEAPVLVAATGEQLAPAARGESQLALPLLTQHPGMQLKEAVGVAPPALSESDLREPLLLARSSYIGDSDEKRFDALRVSRALKEFKWNVEPPYVIGIMVDDNLSVETNIGVISSSMVERVEKLGYKFVAINAPQGSPVAWFKKGARSPLGTDFGETAGTMEIRQGTRTYDKDKAVWEESFVSLLMTVKNMDVQKLKQVTSIIKSERPEPELQS